MLALAGLALTALWHVEGSRQSEQLRALALAQAAEIDGQLLRLAELPAVLAEDPRLGEVLRDPTTTRAANRLLARVQQQTGIGHAYLMDQTGLTVASSNHNSASSFVGQNYGFRQYFVSALRGARGTQYAVGATTGEPGYFVSQPVRVDGDVAGVLVLKLSLSHLSDAWTARDEHTLLVDDSGIVILSSQENMLYASTQALTAETATRLKESRHYPVSAQAKPDLLERPARAQRAGQHYFRASAPLSAETWRVAVLTPRSVVLGRALRNFASLAAVLAVVLLLLRDWWRQRLLITAEQRNARKLAKQIAEKTRELEVAQRTLIENSNLTALGRMSSAINHEVNQPLASLRMNLASLRKLTQSHNPDPAELQHTLEDCERTTKRIGSVVDALRSLSRPGDTRIANIDLGALMREAAETFSREHTPARGSVDYLSPDQRLTCQGNAVLLQQAILNLLQNADIATAACDQPTIRLSANVDLAHTVITVTDNGNGVPASIANTLFEPFVQGENTARGLGLGLALAMQIAQFHQGDLIHERTEQGETRFSLRLPKTDTP